MENNDYRTCFVPDKQLREDRQISRIYSQVQRDIVKTCNRIRRTLEFHGLDEYLPPGRWKGTIYRQLPERLKTMGLSDSLQFSLYTMIEQLSFLWQQKKNIMRQLSLLSKCPKYQDKVVLLKSAPGIRPLTSIRLALEWGNIDQFKRKQEFTSFLGLVPSESSSGEQERKGHITKQGNRHVRSWLVECSWIAIRYDPVLLDKYRGGYKIRRRRLALPHSRCQSNSAPAVAGPVMPLALKPLGGGFRLRKVSIYLAAVQKSDKDNRFILDNHAKPVVAGTNTVITAFCF